MILMIDGKERYFVLSEARPTGDKHPVLATTGVKLVAYETARDGSVRAEDFDNPAKVATIEFSSIESGEAARWIAQVAKSEG